MRCYVGQLFGFPNSLIKEATKNVFCAGGEVTLVIVGEVKSVTSLMVENGWQTIVYAHT